MPTLARAQEGDDAPAHGGVVQEVVVVPAANLEHCS
jgi:hypothetical protein